MFYNPYISYVAARATFRTILSILRTNIHYISNKRKYFNFIKITRTCVIKSAGSLTIFLLDIWGRREVLIRLNSFLAHEHIIIR